MTYAELKDEVSILVRDASPEIVNRIPNAINETLLAFAAMERIPELMTFGAFTTVEDQDMCSAPAGFSGRLLKVGTKSQEIVIHPGGLEGLLGDCDNFGTAIGEVSMVAQEGTNFWYFKRPEAPATYPILYQAEATELVADGDTLPRWLPDYFGRGLIAHGAAAILYNIIEDGIEGDKINTAAQLGLAKSYADKYKTFLAMNRKGYNISIWGI